MSTTPSQRPVACSRRLIGTAALALTATGLAACPSKPAGKREPGAGLIGSGAGPGPGTGTLPVLAPAPPPPTAPAHLPAPPAPITATGEQVALGELLFHDGRLSKDGKTSCATCHDPAADHSGAGRQPNASGAINLRRAPSLTNVAWRAELGWDGRSPRLDSFLPLHWRGQLGTDPSVGITAIARLPLYGAHFQRTWGSGADGGKAIDALIAYVSTRFSGGAPWDAIESTARKDSPEAAGYALFTGKAQCSVCHQPPLYTDGGYHKLGLIGVADDGRGFVDVLQKGAFRTPSLRGAARRKSFFHDGSVTTLAAAVDWHLAGGVGQGADRSIIDPALTPITLTPAERDALLAFVTALTPTEPAPAAPVLPIP
ncbi:MAG: cytochrome-c peroxidase [Kofleriaceae bacterium]|jgi:cytochrome c peroxidase|nr:cytochrome-c peroxidase [Kofleriaceae bacterium]